MYPDAGRYWSMIERHQITHFYTAPTAIRSLMRYGDDIPKRYDLSSLRVLGTVGEPINPEVRALIVVCLLELAHALVFNAWCCFS